MRKPLIALVFSATAGLSIFGVSVAAASAEQGPIDTTKPAQLVSSRVTLPASQLVPVTPNPQGLENLKVRAAQLANPTAPKPPFVGS